MKSNRREFLRKAGAMSVGMSLFPTIVKSSVLGLNGQTPPSDKLNMVLIGSGAMGRGNLSQFLNFEEIQAIAVCDIDDRHLATAKKMVDDKYGNTDCRTYKDFREILEKETIDTAILALPDHWHGIIYCAVANKKIDTYGEKPIARYLSDSKAIAKCVKDNGIVWQTGSQQRSGANFHHACELVRNGRIGKVDYVEVGLPDGGHYIGNPPVQPVPAEADWDMWLGPAPEVPFRGVLHWHWRWIKDYSGGQLTDWAGHHIDIAHWGLDLDRTGPISIEGTGRPNNDGIYNVLAEYDITCTYANGVKIRIANQSKLEHGMGVAFKGTNGYVHVNRSGLYASDENILKEKIGDDEIRLYKSTNHRQNFLECVRSRKETIAPIEVGHRSISVALLGEIAIETGQKLNWDPDKEAFADNNMYATRLMGKPYRAPWVFPE